MFDIKIKRLYWIDEQQDNPDDLCLHGDLEVKIGEECYTESCTVSATGLYLLKSITEEHILGEDLQMLPCCGYFLIANEDLTEVNISGCSNGLDWTILHKDNYVLLITKSGAETKIRLSNYKEKVFDFADEIERY
ncbi:hypothetical protein [Vallitalea okinawensis]|uniref:hypothetical protein n=1 Tax=Vallitalea okinawensis TaxID=2078660 RepID=UPI000CFCAE2C|nr:hypothetical protein [Vallitalea okinawensis]